MCAAHIRLRSVMVRMKWPKKKRKKEAEVAARIEARLKCNEVRSKKDDLIYLLKNKAVPKRRGAYGEITEDREYEIPGE